MRMDGGDELWTEEQKKQWLAEQSVLANSSLLGHAEQLMFSQRFISSNPKGKKLFEFAGREFGIDFCWYLHAFIADNKSRRFIDLQELEARFYLEKKYYD